MGTGGKQIAHAKSAVGSALGRIMKQKFQVLLIIFSLLFFLQQATVFPASAKNVELLHSEKYFEKIHELFKSATKSIVIAMYSFKYYDEYPTSPSNILLQDLIKAEKRGLDVTVLLDISDSTEETTQENKKTGEILSENGIKVSYDKVETLTHAKTIVVDSRYTIIGSHNWTYNGLTKNNEVSVFIDSRDLAKEAEKYIIELTRGDK
jgi:phosphatidylserine/phosphatidylglycerophosphate/cardiolipin synthase-like enzyme